MSKGWDNATLKKLKSLTGKGLSTAEIGKRLGMSKNAIVGKLNRLGWNSKAGGVDAKPAPATKKASATKAAPAKKAATPAKKAVTATAKAPAKAPAKKVATPVKAIKAPAKAAPKKAEPAPKAVKDTKGGSKNLAMHQRIIQHSLGMANLKSDQCRWPIGDPDSENFHFCGEAVFVGKPYCYEHCKCAYQFQPVKKK